MKLMTLRRLVPIVVLAGGLAIAPAAGAEEHHGAHKHHFSYLVGLSDNGTLDETAFTIGAGYRYALSDRFAIGPSVDFAFYDHEDTTLLVAALYWKPAGNLLLMAGPGVELVDYEGSSSGSSHDTRTATASESAHEDESKFAFRVGAGYELHVRGVTVTPAVGADFIGGHTTLVYAVAVGFGF